MCDAAGKQEGQGGGSMGADDHQIGAAVLLLDHNLPAGVAAPESGQDPVSPDAEGVREAHEMGLRAETL
jgi:hypothetical protein